VAKAANTNLNTDLKAIFDAIESSANGYPSEPDIKGLFADFDTTCTRLGNTVDSKNSRSFGPFVSSRNFNEKC
jgi:type I restriction enzyme M protein